MSGHRYAALSVISCPEISYSSIIVMILCSLSLSLSLSVIWWTLFSRPSKTTKQKQSKAEEQHLFFSLLFLIVSVLACIATSLFSFSAYVKICRHTDWSRKFSVSDPDIRGSLLLHQYQGNTICFISLSLYIYLYPLIITIIIIIIYIYYIYIYISSSTKQYSL